MSLPPRLSRIVTPPYLPSGPGDTTMTAEGAISSLSARTHLHRCIASRPANSTGFPSVQRLMTFHPVLPHVAYVLESTHSSSDKLIAVQDVLTHQVLWNVSWYDVAACVYHSEDDPRRLPSAAKRLGRILQLDFCDGQTLYWSGVMGAPRKEPSPNSSDGSTNKPTATPKAPYTQLSGWAYLLVQTTHGCLVLHLRHSPYSDCIYWTQASPPSRLLARRALLHAHMEPSVASSTSAAASTDGVAAPRTLPTSNWLALSASLFLVGCSDGSLQCWTAGPVSQTRLIKCIRGLGSSGDATTTKDYITMLVPANPYHQAATVAVAAAQASPMEAPGDGALPVPDLSQKRRIIAVTKRGIAYLLEIEWKALSVEKETGSSESRNDNAGSMMMMIELKPPLAKFVGGAGWWSGNDAAGMEHRLFHYDAHRDWVLWLQPAGSSSSTNTPTATSASSRNKTTSSSNATTLYVWNIKAMEKEIMANTVGGVAKSFLRPEPTLILQFPNSDDANLTVLPTILHTAFHEDTVVCAVVTDSGDFWLQAASIRSRNTTASPVLGVRLADLIQSTANMDQSPIVRVHGLATQPLGDRSPVLIATNLGILAIELPSAVGDRHFHLGAGLGTFGKSLLSVNNSEFLFGSLDVLKSNPYGIMEPKNAVTIHESPPPLHFPTEYQKRPFRLAPQFLPSPTGTYICSFNPGEYQYEILHLPSLLQRVGQHRGNTTAASPKPVVSAGTGVASFAWVGDEDCYAILHAEDWMNEAISLMTASAALSSGEGQSAGSSSLFAGVSTTTKRVGGAAALVGGATLKATKAAKSTTMAAATKATKAATIATTTTTKTAVSGLKKGAKLATFGVFSKKKKRGSSGRDDDDTETDMGMSTVTDDLEDTGPILEMLQAGEPLPIDSAGPAAADKRAKKRYVELRSLEAIEQSSDHAVGSIPAATSSSLGHLNLRGGGQNLPVALFGGPVLCVASQVDGNDAGQAHFYTLKPDETERSASLYVSSGPTLPFPDLCVWDDEGTLCAIILGNRVSVYLSECPHFVLLGSVRIGPGSGIHSAKFIHGVLYCCTWYSVHCILLGDLEGRVCHMDAFTLASSWIMGEPEVPLADGEYRSFSPPCLPLPVVLPTVLGYQNGSLLVSSARGVFAIPLIHPLLRLGILLASAQVERAEKWLDAFPNQDHESLANFLERRGQVQLALEHLDALSLETIIDLSIRYSFIDRLCCVVEQFGVKGIRAVDYGRGYSNTDMFGPEPSNHSLIISVCAYLLAHGKVELVRRLASELLRLEDGRKEALLLASLLLQVNEPDATRLMGRAADLCGDWTMGSFIRDHVLRQQ